MAAIPVEYTASLTVLLLDERFGVPGHPNSNWQQLQDAGLNPQQARVTPVLQAEQTFETTVEAYEQAVRRVIDDSDIIIAQCGIGGDGHIAGILPHSAAIAAQEWVCGYDGGTYKRITITPSAWQHIDVAYAFAYGETKHGTLVHLKNNTLSVNDQPAQLLKITPEAYVYTDQQV
jgi:6-phosphogluconolactonase/glucosamine-6-phosphate isomerase/deaminase